MFKNKEEIIYGYHPVLEAIQKGINVDKVLFSKNLSRSKYEEVLYLCRQQNIPTQFVPREKLSRITNQNHQGIIAINALIDYQDIELIIPHVYEQGGSPLVLILDGVTDVRNFGSIARSAECAGVDAIVIPLRGSAQINSEAIKTSAGALSTIPVCRVESLADLIDFLQKSGLSVYAITEKGNKAYYEENFENPTALIMGDEETGINKLLLEKANELLTIPMKGNISSLNVSVAAGIVLFETIKKH